MKFQKRNSTSFLGEAVGMMANLGKPTIHRSDLIV